MSFKKTSNKKSLKNQATKKPTEVGFLTLRIITGVNPHIPLLYYGAQA
ncbi:hypothetical protein UFOVP39_45 [uncultured Caudovirales phage]|uniref:Uncharacterized protein n=1 Tax=uncultured Caudovirales phage TaxID=2100421 RepID=A0A6J5TB09_9CAUD|nr:hypothetical protein UFOVP39_45 [uncultured Caudovirales phage]